MSLGYKALRVYNQPERWFQKVPVTLRLFAFLAIILTCIGLEVVGGNAIAMFWYHFDFMVTGRSIIFVTRFVTMFGALCLGFVDLVAIKLMCAAAMRSVFEKRPIDAKKQRLFGRVVRSLNAVTAAMLVLFAVSGLLGR